MVPIRDRQRACYTCPSLMPPASSSSAFSPTFCRFAAGSAASVDGAALVPFAALAAGCCDEAAASEAANTSHSIGFVGPTRCYVWDITCGASSAYLGAGRRV